ncbi:MAG: hypothetical protein ACP5UN_01755 [Candidatus Micrarchaeia archaeon]
MDDDNKENIEKIKSISEVQNIENEAHSAIDKARLEADKKIKESIENSAKKIMLAKTNMENTKKAYFDKLIKELDIKTQNILKEAKENATKIKHEKLSKIEMEKLIKNILNDVL